MVQVRSFLRKARMLEICSRGVRAHHGDHLAPFNSPGRPYYNLQRACNPMQHTTLLRMSVFTREKKHTVRSPSPKAIGAHNVSSEYIQSRAYKKPAVKVGTSLICMCPGGIPADYLHGRWKPPVTLPLL